jgi:hypothetical protein
MSLWWCAVDKAEFLGLQKEFHRLTGRAPNAMISRDGFQEAMQLLKLFDTGVQRTVLVSRQCTARVSLTAASASAVAAASQTKKS